MKLDKQWAAVVQEPETHLWIVETDDSWTLKNGTSTDVVERLQPLLAIGIYRDLYQNEFVSNNLSLHQAQQQEF